jgi:histidinol-phosphate/aromatic aminotransferase/cobyric acid decarboxylase-like protein
MSQYGPGMLPVTGMVGATASLGVKNLVAERREIIGGVRESTLEFLRKHGIGFVPSESNKFMVDVKRPAREVVSALAGKHIYVGRVWPSMPEHIRVSVGTREEMARFQKALLEVLQPA